MEKKGKESGSQMTEKKPINRDLYARERKEKIAYLFTFSGENESYTKEDY